MNKRITVNYAMEYPLVLNRRKPRIVKAEMSLDRAPLGEAGKAAKKKQCMYSAYTGAK